MIKIKFRLNDGSDIGPADYEDQLTVESLKEKVIAGWPKGKSIVPKEPSELKLISSGKVLENSKTVGQCKLPFSDADDVITMHAVVQLAQTKAKSEKKIDDDPKKKICSCSIL
ncbi:unnamed protein product [Cuscuta campestris]|uniref:Membrane-anchored ubiquitin-fold protein n=1 Tax=Cuscuta campestris TaxID=132261 RepID=A0A484LU06_9ASTE|nr:unnamed protein product [Cuscuta campestris]